MMSGCGSWSCLALVLLCSVLALYLWGWRTVEASFPGVLRTWRIAAFAVGIAVLGAATGSPLETLADHSLTAHTAQHLFIMTAAAPLILLGAPIVVLTHRLPWWFCRAFTRGSRITHPIFCWLAGMAAVIGWHIPAIFAVAMKSQGWQAFEQGTFLAAGILFWWPMIRPWPSVAGGSPWSTPIYLLLAALPFDALAAFLCLCNRVVYPHYGAAGGLSALKDQACAGAMMWVWVALAYLSPTAILTFRLLSRETPFVEKPVV